MSKRKNFFHHASAANKVLKTIGKMIIQFKKMGRKQKTIIHF